MRRPIRNHVWLVALLAVAPASTLLITGCRGCSLPSITITLPFGQNTPLNLPVPAGLPFEDVVIPLGGENCEIEGLNDLIAQIQARAPQVLTNLIGIDRCIVDRIHFQADTGDFNFITELRFTIHVEGPGGPQDFELAATSDTGLGASFDLTSEEPLDLWALVNGDAECISGEITLSGVSPEEPVIFDTSLVLTIFPIFRP
ncbi:MAG: hypothetical protein HYV26_14935 [Candidatus Hydrogenedentes bacterium]|nr:hypothetical protein [Candidatus Hydrogenedentota bacterium]